MFIKRKKDSISFYTLMYHKPTLKSSLKAAENFTKSKWEFCKKMSSAILGFSLLMSQTLQKKDPVNDEK